MKTARLTALGERLGCDSLIADQPRVATARRGASEPRARGKPPPVHTPTHSVFFLQEAAIKKIDVFILYLNLPCGQYGKAKLYRHSSRC